jgi:hypothetical protein
MPGSDPFFHIYAGIVIVLVGFVVVELRRLRRNLERK